MLGFVIIWRQQRDPLRRKPGRSRSRAGSHQPVGLVHVQAHVHAGSGWPAHRHLAGDAFRERTSRSATWVLSDPSDIIGTTVGGNRYGWFVQNEFDGLAIDNSFRTGIVSTPNCETQDQRRWLDHCPEQRPGHVRRQRQGVVLRDRYRAAGVPRSWAAATDLP